MARLLRLVLVCYVLTIARTKQLVPSDDGQSLATIVEGKYDTNPDTSGPDEPHVKDKQQEIDTRLTALHEDVLKNDNFLVTKEKEGKSQTDCSLKIAEHIKLTQGLEERYKGEIQHYKKENDILQEYIHGLEKNIQDKVEAVVDNGNDRIKIAENINGENTKLIRGLEEQITSCQAGQVEYKAEEECPEVPQDCADILRLDPAAQSGLHLITVHGADGYSQQLTVFCDMETDGGGWMVIQRRSDGSMNFYRDHQSYKEGFGIRLHEFWHGNEELHLTTSRWNYELRVDLENFYEEHRHAKYGRFLIHPECEDYRLEVDFYSGDAGNALYFSNEMPFTTFDREFGRNSISCADKHHGPWWHNSCTRANLNGLYHQIPVPDETGIFWYDWEGHISLKSTVMMIRPAPLFCPELPHDCAEILRQNPEAPSGGYTIYTTDGFRIDGSMRVFCDMDTDGGGWTVFQRRTDGSVDFFRSYQSYMEGFGDVTGEFWWGNDNLHLLTNRCDQDLRFDLMDENNDRRYAQYASFLVGPDDDGYRVNFTTYSGTAGDSFTWQNGMMFSTYDRDQDTADILHCAVDLQGAWWFAACDRSHVNGRYYTQSPPHWGVRWEFWTGSGDFEHLRFTEMKIRPSGECD